MLAKASRLYAFLVSLILSLMKQLLHPWLLKLPLMLLLQCRLVLQRLLVPRCQKPPPCRSHCKTNPFSSCNINSRFSSHWRTSLAVCVISASSFLNGCKPVALHSGQTPCAGPANVLAGQTNPSVWYTALTELELPHHRSVFDF